MKVEYINPFLNAAITVFQTMLRTTLIKDRPFIKKGNQPNYEVSGMIGLSGKAKGMVVLSLSREAAFSIVQVLLGDRPISINADVADAVGEITSIIAGSAKAQLEHLQLSVSLPTVIIGKSHCIEFPKNVSPICIPFESNWGPIIVEVGIIDV